MIVPNTHKEAITAPETTCKLQVVSSFPLTYWSFLDLIVAVHKLATPYTDLFILDYLNVKGVPLGYENIRVNARSTIGEGRRTFSNAIARLITAHRIIKRSTGYVITSEGKAVLIQLRIIIEGMNNNK